MSKSTQLLACVRRVLWTSVVCLGLGCAAVQAADVTWVGSAGEGDGVHWADPKNWNPQTLPTSADTVVFTSAAVVDNNLEGLSVKGVRSTGGAVTISGNALTVGADGIVNSAAADLTFDLPVAVTYYKVCQQGADWSNSTVFKKGFSAGDWRAGGTGALVFKETPIKVTGILLQDQWASWLHFSAPSNQVKSMRAYWGANMYLEVPDAIVGEISIGHTDTADRQPTLYLCDCDQRTITSFVTTCPASLQYFPVVTSTGKAVIYLSGSSQKSQTCVAKFTGKAGLCWAPAEAETIDFKYATHTTAGELTVSNGTMIVSDGASFSSLSKLTVADGAVFEVTSVAEKALVSEVMEIHENGTLRLASEVKAKAKSMRIRRSDGSLEFVAGDTTLTKSNCDFIDGEGSLYVELPATPTATATWDAGGADDHLRTAANWNPDVVPDLTSGGTKAVFIGGTSVTVDEQARLHGLEIKSTSGDFAFWGDKALKLFASGISLSAGASSRQLAFEAPVEIGQNQSWTLQGAADSLAIRSGLTGASDVELTVSGGAMLAIEDCETTFTGNLISPTTGRVVLKNADVGGNLTLSNGSVALYDYASNESAASADSRSSIIRGELCFKGGNNVYCRGRLVLAGGVRQDNAVYLKGGVGTIVITNKPNAAASVRAWFVDNSTTTELWAPGNLLNFTLYNNAKVRCKVAGALNGAGSLDLGISAFDSDRRGWFYMDGDQGISTLTTYVARHGSCGQEIFSDGHAVLTTADSSDKTHYVIFKGGASYRQTGAGSVVFCKASTSTGTVDVVAGTLTFGNATNGTYRCIVEQKDYAIASEGGSWTNAARVTVGGGDSAALVRILHDKTFGRETAVEIAQNGGVYLADGVVEKVRSLSIDGQPMGGGNWGSPTSSAYHKSSRFSGNGILRVKGGGIVVVVR